MTAPLPTVPVLLETDPATIDADVIAALEDALGRPLQAAQVERILGSLIAYRETLLRIQIQDVAMQNLLAFARAPMLDYHGERVGATRLPAVAAVCTLAVTLSAVQPLAVVIPAGTRVQSTDGAIVFTTQADLSIASGLTAGTVDGLAQVTGAQGNGYAPGTISVVLDPVAHVSTIANSDETSGGADVEDDDAFRDRIRQAINAFSVAGSKESYRYHAFTVSAAIVDVLVDSPEPGSVRVCVLTATGAPDSSLLTAVAAALSDDRVRPLTDTVAVVAATPVAYDIVATVRPLVGADGASVLAAAQAAAESFAAARTQRLGGDVTRSQVIKALSVDGVYDVTVSGADPLASVDADAFAAIGAIMLTLGTEGY